MNIDKSKPVLVTGATGYVAGWVVKRLLEEGLIVHAAVRDPEDPAKLKYLNQVARNAPGTIKYFKADLLKSDSFADAMANCQVVFHTASPFKTDVKDPQKELVDPARLGTRNVLEEANRVESVKRVVVTSSCAAIYGDNADLLDTPDHVFTEDVWNTSASLDHQAYSYSKTVAEQEAWKMAEAQSNWKLVVLNPSLVMGPGINPFGTSESFNIIRQLGDGTLKTGVPQMGFGLVDVRDLADAHLKAAFMEGAQGRNIISGHNTDFPEMAAVLREKYGTQYPIPKSTVPKWLLWLVGPMINKVLTRKVVMRNVNYPWKADHSKSVRELNMTYRPLKDSLQEFFQQMIDSGQLPTPGRT